MKSPIFLCDIPKDCEGKSVYSFQFHRVWFFFHEEKLVLMWNMRPTSDDLQRGYVDKTLSKELRALMCADLDVLEKDLKKVSAEELVNKGIQAVANNVRIVIDITTGMNPEADDPIKAE